MHGITVSLGAYLSPNTGCLPGQSREERGCVGETPCAWGSCCDRGDCPWLQILTGVLPAQFAETTDCKRSRTEGTVISNR